MSTVLASTTTLPTVTYDLGNRTINMTVIALPTPPGSNTFTIVVSPCAIPRGTWTVYWDLVLPEGVSAHLANIVLPRSPLASGNVTIDLSQSFDKSRWMAVIDNQVMEVNAFSYTIQVEPDPDPTKFMALAMPHDPTIAVTGEPIDG